MPQNSIEGSSQTDPIPLGDFLRSPEEVLGATGDPAREEKMQGRALSAEVDALTGMRDDQVEALEAGTAGQDARQKLDGTNEALLSATADLIEHQGPTGAGPKDK